MPRRRAQAAFEYMIIVGIVIVFLIPVWTYISGVQYRTSTELSLSYAKNAATRIASTADLVYSQGPPAKVNVKIFMPEGVTDVNITNRTIEIKVRIGAINSSVFAESDAQLNGTLPLTHGNYWISVEATDSYVQITPV
jgi:uncharacterized protein (UPF0333 family)